MLNAAVLQVPFSGHMTFIQRRLNVDATSCGHMTFIQRRLNVDATSYGHMTFIQRRLNVDATSWRCIDVEATLYKRLDVASTLRRRCINVMCPLGMLIAVLDCLIIWPKLHRMNINLTDSVKHEKVDHSQIKIAHLKWSSHTVPNSYNYRETHQYTQG